MTVNYLLAFDGWQSKFLRLKIPSFLNLKTSFSFVAALLGIVLLIAGLYGAYNLVKLKYNLLLPSAASFVNYVPGHVWWFGITFGIGLLATIAMRLPVKGKWEIRPYLAFTILIVVFTQGGILFKNYNPTTPQQFFYPTNPAMAQLKQIVGNKTVMYTGWDGVPAPLNLYYRLHQITNYDSLWVKNYDTLFRSFYDSDWSRAITNTFNELGLRLFGVDYVVSSIPPEGMDRNYFTGLPTQTQGYPYFELTPGIEVSESFKSTEDYLNKLQLFIATSARTNTCSLNFQLQESSSNKIVSQQTIPCQTIPDSKEFFITFPPIANSKNREYRITLSSPNGKPGNAVTPLLWGQSSFGSDVANNVNLIYQNAKLFLNNKSHDGSLMFSIFYDRSYLEPVAKAGGQWIYRNRNSLSRYYSVDQAIVANNDDEAMQLIMTPGFDPATTVIISKGKEPLPQTNIVTTAVASSNPATSATATPVEILEEKDALNRLKVNRVTSGYVVMNTSNFPGWHVKVNGVEKPLLRANYGFNAVEVSSGESIIELYYDPASFRSGLYITLATAIFSMIIVAGWVVRRGFLGRFSLLTRLKF
jgi:hypothetical protein